MRDQLGPTIRAEAQVIFLPPTLQPLPGRITGISSLATADNPNAGPSVEVTIVLNIPVGQNGVVPAIFMVSPEGLVQIAIQHEQVLEG